MRLLLMILLGSCIAAGQGAQEAEKKSEQSPPVKVNLLNVCTPNAEDQQQLKATLAHLPKSPSFVTDYEISRGVSTLEEGKTAKYVRVRREFKSDSPLATIQYSLSSDPESTIETLVFRAREPKDILTLSIEDRLSTSVSKPTTVIQSDTPASRLRLERAGKTTLALARCEGVDQSQYESIFAQASSALADYRRLLRLRTMLASDVAWLAEAPKRKASGPANSSSGKPGAEAAPR